MIDKSSKWMLMIGGSIHAQSRGMSVLRINHMSKWCRGAVIDGVIIAVECRGLFFSELSYFVLNLYHLSLDADI